MNRIAIAVLLAGACLHAGATGGIYRCGNEYTQEPCPGGKLLDVADPRSAAQRNEALKVAAAERRLAAELAHERKAREAAQKASAAKAGASSAEHGKGKKKRAKVVRVVPLKSAP